MSMGVVVVSGGIVCRGRLALSSQIRKVSLYLAQPKQNVGHLVTDAPDQVSDG